MQSVSFFSPDSNTGIFSKKESDEASFRQYFKKKVKNRKIKMFTQ